MNYEILITPERHRAARGARGVRMKAAEARYAPIARTVAKNPAYIKVCDRPITSPVAATAIRTVIIQNIEKPEVRYQVFLVVRREHIRNGGLIGRVRIKRRLSH